MVRHIVMWRLHPEADGYGQADNAERARRALLALRDVIDDIVTLEVGINELPGADAADLVLVSSFHDYDALDRYQKHPAHQEVVALMGRIRAEKRSADFITEDE